jgi:hypothetical protein
MIDDFEEKQRRNLESIEELLRKNPFSHGDITKFYQQHQGDTPNSFIQTRFLLRDYHDVIYSLLNFLDKHGDIVLFVDFKHGIAFEPDADANTHAITLKDHTLRVTEKVVRSLKFEDYEQKLYWTNIKMLRGGIAALSYNVGLGLGKEYCEHYSNDLSQASLSVLENMPVLSRLRNFEDIKELIRLYHTYMHRSMDYKRDRLERNNTSWDLGIVRLLIDAEMQARRKEIFKYAGKNTEALWFGGETKKKAEAGAYKIAQLAESERQQHNVNFEEEFQRKKDAYVGELRGLRNSRDQLAAENKIKDKIIKALKKNDKEAVKLAEDELKELRKNFSEKAKGEASQGE